MSKISYEQINQCAYGVGIIRLNNFDQDYESIDFFSTRLEGQTNYIAIYDNLDSYFRTAELILEDRYSLREFMPLTGNEIVSIKYKNLHHDPSTPEKIYHFFIVNVQDEQNTTEPNRGSNFIKLILVEAPIYYFLTTNSIYKTYKWDGGSKSSAPKKAKSIYSLLIDTLLCVPNIEKWYNIEVEETGNSEDDKINFYIPNWTPYKTLNYLRKFAINKDNFPYYIFNVKPPEKLGKKPTIVLKSIYSYMLEKGAHQFVNHFANQSHRPSTSTNEPVRDFTAEQDFFDMTNIYFKRYITYFNRIKTSFAKLSGETFFTFDYINGNKYLAYEFDDFRNKYKGLGNYFLHQMKYGNQWAKFRPHSFTEPKRIISMKLNEFAYETIHSSIGGMFYMPINSNRFVGQLADILFKNPVPDINIDLMLSGKWLIWGQIDYMTNTGSNGWSVVFCLKDGFEKLYEPPKEMKKMTNLSPLIK